MSLVALIKERTAKALEDLYGAGITGSDVMVNQTKPEFEGNYTVVLFSLIKQLKKSPEALGNEIGEYLMSNNKDLFTSFNIIQGFLNLSVTDSFFIDHLA